MTRIFVRSLKDGQLAAEDRTYLAQLVAQRTNLTQADAERRVDEVYARTQKAVADAKLAAQQAADTAAKVAALTTLWMFVALLAGAFFASLAATFGGRRRDAVVYVETDTYVTTAPDSLIQENHHAFITAVLSRRADPDHHPDRVVHALIYWAGAWPLPAFGRERRFCFDS